eukprot:3378764-Lingulodinium_polyedra.AAC.1
MVMVPAHLKEIPGAEAFQGSMSELPPGRRLPAKPAPAASGAQEGRAGEAARHEGSRRGSPGRL